MPDLLVSLYSRKFDELLSQAVAPSGVTIRPPLAPELHIVRDWVLTRFSENWASEVVVAFSRQPVGCLIAVDDAGLQGFACYDVTARGFFGPTGVAPEARGKGIGIALLAACLQALKTLGHAYAFVGDAGPVDFYVRSAGAIVIPASDKGIYEGMLRTTTKT
ncbi:acetyltransferase (GNAT) family protein [Neorhizobium sp. R1-B]|uniref:GNAT family N-acetyltransferase n=1 Tax=unclassified Neorhizobium TaxID=2629175 RepID=UPI000DD5695E|nr:MULTISPECIES: GNAT family N-acetyltransferase [unclassified Neorhizobium]TCV72193.1 acetyltransferase (GNAT) family protein [Neorhizobium sp. S3-V5DH]TDX85003.1 acetyltransferase (GNAT) family protein [Neorhizobium sp. R1-B]